MWALIDNYDSFTHILHHYLLQTGHECQVFRNDALSVEELITLRPSRLIISPGPETPHHAGITMEALAHFGDKIPVLGVCLGHQAIGLHFGATLIHAPYPMHGKISQVAHSGHPLFENIPQQFPVMRYHSLALEGLKNTSLQSIATSTDDGCIQALVHESLPVVGVQFHPESVGTLQGQQLLNNWAKAYSSD